MIVLKVKKKLICFDRVEKLWWCIILPGGVLICNLGESRERARCGVSVASLRKFFYFFYFFVLMSFLSTFYYLYLFVIVYDYYHFSFLTLT